MAARGDDQRAALPVLLAAVLLVVAGAGAGGARLLDAHPADAPPTPPAPTLGCLTAAPGAPGSCTPVRTVLPPPGGTATPVSTPALPSWVPVVALALLLVAGAAVLVVLLRRRSARGAPPPGAAVLDAVVSSPRPEDDGRAPDLTAAVAAARSLAAAAGEPRRRVIDAWTTLEGAVAASGSPRGPGETTGELVRRVLGATVDPAALDELHATYLRARYSPAPVPAADPERAVALLVRVQGQLGGRAAAR